MPKKKKGSKKYNKALWVMLLTIAILLPYALFVMEKQRFDKILSETERAAFILVDKETLMLKVFDYKGSQIFATGISCGKGYGNKQSVDDLRTPEGVFYVCDIQDASEWTHDFNDGKGVVNGAYGPIFIRLEVPGHKGIGIHGTHKPESIGTRDSEGCIRLENSELLKLMEYVYVGMVVVISPSAEDVVRIKSQIEKT